MGLRLVRLVTALLVGLAAAAVTPEARADEASEAARLFEEGTTLLEQDRCAEAIAKLQAALELSPGIGARYNLGLCLEKLGRTASAWRAFEAVAELARSSGKKAREDAARTKLRELRPRLSVLVLHVADAGAPDLTVKLDGVYVPPESFTFLPVDPGRHEVRVTASAREPWSVELEAPVAGQQRELEVPRLAAPVARARVVTVTKRVDDSRRTLAFALGGVGIVSAVTAGVTGVMLLDAKAVADDRCTPACRDANGALDSEGVDAVNRGRALLPVNAVAFGVAAVGLAAGTVLLLLGKPQPSASPVVRAGGVVVRF